MLEQKATLVRRKSTKAQIKSYLDDQGVEYTSKMTKSELLELVKE